MTQEEIRKLLGGYATNSLTDRERTAVFEAALEDQEFFNALQNEGALRELLADPATREQVRLALEPAATSGAFWSKRWFMSAASLAATAAIVIGIVVGATRLCGSH